MQALVSEFSARRAPNVLVMLLLMVLLLLKTELGVLQLLHLRYGRDRAAVWLAGRVQQLALRRRVVEGVPEVIIVRLALMLTDCNRKDAIDAIEWLRQ